MFAAGRILRHSRRLSSVPGGGILGVAVRPRRKEKRKFRCYMPFMWSALVMSFVGITIIMGGTAMCVAGWYLGHFGSDDLVTTTTVVDQANVTDAVTGLPNVTEAQLLPNAVRASPNVTHAELLPNAVWGPPKAEFHDGVMAPPNITQAQLLPNAEMGSPKAEFLPSAVRGRPNVTDADDQLSTVFGVSVEIPPARGLAYAGPVVMSFGCFAVVFACVVVCETRDRVIETMDDRVRRGLPARPPGGIDADFYALVVEFRKRRVEKQRRRRKQLRSDDDEDQNVEEDQNVDCAAAAASPLQPTPSTADVQSPSTINDFVEDRGDDAQPTPDLPTVRLEGPEEATGTAACGGIEAPATVRCSNADIRPSRKVDPQPVSAERQAVSNLSLSWRPAASQTSRSSLSFDNDVFSDVADAPRQSVKAASVTSLPTSEADRSHVTTTPSQLPFPLLAPISSMTQTRVLPYVRLESESPPPVTQPTYLVHTASVHAIADRSPDFLPQPDTTSFQFPLADVRRTCDAGTSGGDDVATASGKLNSGTYADVESQHVSGSADDCASGSKFSGSNVDACDLERPGDSEPSKPEESCSSGGLTASSVAAVYEAPAADAVKRRHCNPYVDHKRFTVADAFVSSDDLANKYPDWSSRSPYDTGPSRKRSRGSTVRPERQGPYSQIPTDDDSAPPVPCLAFPSGSVDRPSSTSSSPAGSDPIAGCSSADREVAADTFGSRPGRRSPTHDAVYPRRRRPNGIRQLLTVQRRRRRPPDRTDFAMSSPPPAGQEVFTLPRRSFDADDDRSLSAAAGHLGADERETLLGPTSSVEGHAGRLPRGDSRANRNDETSPLIWLRRRTTATTSPQRLCRQTSDSFQSTV